MFKINKTPINTEPLRNEVTDPSAGGYASFEGWTRNHNDGQIVSLLEYDVYEAMALKQGAVIINDALKKFAITKASCVHRQGVVAIGEMAVWVGVSATHRGPAFDACRYIIDRIKHELPIWKKETYENGDSGWVACERCSNPGTHHSHHS